MTDKFRVTEFMGGGEPIVTIACAKADWEAIVKSGQENAELKRQLAAREAELADRDARIVELERQVKRQKDARRQAMECTRCCECGAICVNSQNIERRNKALERYQETGETEPPDLCDGSGKES